MSEFLAVLSSLGSAATSLINRKALRKERISYLSYSIIYHLAGAVILFPFLFFYPFFPSENAGWAYAGISALLWSVLGIIGFYNIKNTEASRLVILKRFKIISLFFLSVLFLGEVISAKKLVSFLFILGGTALLSFKSKNLFVDRNSMLILAASFISALTLLVDKKALTYFSLPAYGFFMYLLPGLIILYYSKGKVFSHYLNLRGMRKWVLANTVFDIASYLFILGALVRGSALVTGLLLELAMPFTVIGGILFLNERRELNRIIVALMLSLAGGLIALS